MTQKRQGVPSFTPARRGLGRGLGALIPTAPPEDADAGSDAGEVVVASEAQSAASGTPQVDVPAGAYFAELPLSAVIPNPRQPRQVFDPDMLAELTHSLREVGLLQPVVVRSTGPGAYELIMGERRWRAAQLAGFTTIPAIVRATDDDSLLLDALLENLHRAALNPLEEAAAYDQLLKDFDCTHDVLAARIGRSRSQVSNTLRLLKLPVAVQRRVAAGVLSAGHARALLGIENPDDQERIAGRIVAEGLSVRAVEELAAVGDGTKPRARRAPAGQPHSEAAETIAATLADRWDTRVKVQLGQGRGRMIVEFASVDDLERIVALMGPKA